MAKLLYVTVTSLDGYIGDNHYDWSTPSEGSTGFITEVMRPIGTYLYGRKNYETMSFWESPSEKFSSEDDEFARVWQAADKIIYSQSLKSVTTKKTRLEHEFDVKKIRDMKSRSQTDICIGGPTLAAQAMRAGLVDEIHLFMVPFTIGNGIPTIPILPKDNALKLELIDERRFSKNWMYLRYKILP